MFQKSHLAWVAVGLSFTACAPSLDQARARDENHSVPESYGKPAAEAKESSAVKKAEEFFSDNKLVSLIDEALQNNQELNIVEQEILIANNEIMARRGEYLPKLGLGVQAGIEKVGRNTSQGAADDITEIAPGTKTPEHLPNFRLGLFASWEVDVWKKLRNATKSALLTYLSSIEGKNFLVTSLVSEIADSYYELVALDNQLQVLGRNVKILEDALEVVNAQKNAGRVTQLAVQRFQAEVLKYKSHRYDIQQRIVETENRINVLVGRFPQHVDRSSDEFAQLTPQVVYAGVPTQLLENRPDVKQAQLRLEASKLDVEVAKAGFYPSLSIEAGVGVEGFTPKHMFMLPESILYNAVAGIVAPLLNRNMLTAAYFSANSKQWQAVYQYEQTLRRAYTETANQLALVENLDKKYEFQSQQVSILEDSIQVSNVLFSSARADYMEVLLTRRDTLEAEMELIETKRNQLGAMVNVYRALGGGWRGHENEDGKVLAKGE